MKPSYIFDAEVIRVVDGDTLEVLVDCGFETWRKLTVRLHGIDAPEQHTVKHTSEEYKRGVAATEWVDRWLNEEPVVIRSHDAKKIDTGSLNRWIAIVERSDGHILNDDIVEAGHAIVKKY